MELGEKLQELRREKGITQEELAEALYVSRTAVSKWESGRGYPNIESIKELSKFYSVSIDELLSSERLITLATKENKRNLSKVFNMFLGIIDLMFFLLIVLPLYPKSVNGFIYSVNLIEYKEVTSYNLAIYWCTFIILVVLGLIREIMLVIKSEMNQKVIDIITMIVGAMTVVYLIMATEPYAATLAFILIGIKAMIIGYRSIISIRHG